MAGPEATPKARSAARPDYGSRRYKRKYKGKVLTGAALVAAFLTVYVINLR